MMVVKRRAEAESDGRPTALGCHIYAGGFAIGVRKAGFNILAHLEEWPFGGDTVRRNLGIKIHEGLDSWDRAVDRHAGKVDFFFANPPCATWSEAGRKVKDKEERNVDRWAKDDRTDCTRRVFALVPRIDPKVFVWESVAAATVNGDRFVRERIADMNELGYDVHGLLFNGCDLGLPQTRKRFFFVASKVKLKVFEPDGEPLLPRDVFKEIRRSGRKPEFPDHLPTGYLKLWKRAEPGEPLHKVYMSMWDERDEKPPRNAHGGMVGRPGFMHQKINPDKLCPTVTGSCHIYHHAEPRGLSVDEMKMMCGYPIDYEFEGRLGLKYAQIAKAVLPPAGNWVARIVRRSLKANEPVRRPGCELHNFIKGGRRFAETWDDADGEAA